MTKYKCSGCKYENADRSKVRRHIDGKNKCAQGELTIEELADVCYCEKCAKLFQNKLSRDRHQRKCEGKAAPMVETLVTQVKSLQQQNKELEKFMKELMEQGKAKVQAAVDSKKYTPLPEGTDELCQHCEQKQFVPTSKKGTYDTLKEHGTFDDDLVQVTVKGARALLVNADITNKEYIEFDDGTKFYYNPQRGQNKARDLKVVFMSYCSNQAQTSYQKQFYCLDCYYKVKNSHKAPPVLESSESESSNESKHSGDSDWTDSPDPLPTEDPVYNEFA